MNTCDLVLFQYRKNKDECLLNTFLRHCVSCLKAKWKREGHVSYGLSPGLRRYKGGGLWLTMAIYADDLNLIGTIDAISQIVPQLKVQFEMKNLGETTMCLNLQVEYLAICILLH